MPKILIIDDSSFQRRIVTSLLRDEGHVVITAENGRDGIGMARSESPDLIVSDLLMPEFDGYYLLREARESGPAVPILILTSDIQDTTRDECIRLGAAGLVNKPVKREALLSAIAQVLSGDRR